MSWWTVSLGKAGRGKGEEPYDRILADLYEVRVLLGELRGYFKGLGERQAAEEQAGK